MRDILGTSLDGRFFADDRTAWRSTVSALGTLAGVNASHPVLEGADTSYRTTRGYDEVTGLGTPNVPAFIEAFKRY